VPAHDLGRHGPIHDLPIPNLLRAFPWWPLPKLIDGSSNDSPNESPSTVDVILLDELCKRRPALVDVEGQNAAVPAPQKLVQPPTQRTWFIAADRSAM
jgi:hypothetical protein